jgi:hypothetical protein
MGRSLRGNGAAVLKHGQEGLLRKCSKVTCFHGFISLNHLGYGKRGSEKAYLYCLAVLRYGYSKQEEQ